MHGRILPSTGSLEHIPTKQIWNSPVPYIKIYQTCYQAISNLSLPSCPAPSSCWSWGHDLGLRLGKGSNFSSLVPSKVSNWIVLHRSNCWLTDRLNMIEPSWTRKELPAHENMHFWSILFFFLRSTLCEQRNWLTSWPFQIFPHTMPWYATIFVYYIISCTGNWKMRGCSVSTKTLQDQRIWRMHSFCQRSLCHWNGTNQILHDFVLCYGHATAMLRPFVDPWAAKTNTILAHLDTSGFAVLLAICPVFVIICTSLMLFFFTF